MAWHFTLGDKLRDGRTVPPIGETLKHRGQLVLCLRGLHASERLVDALAYAPGTVLHRVECSGTILWGYDKLVCNKRTVVTSADMTLALVEFSENCAKRAVSCSCHKYVDDVTQSVVDAVVRYADAAHSIHPCSVVQAAFYTASASANAAALVASAARAAEVAVCVAKTAKAALEIAQAYAREAADICADHARSPEYGIRAVDREKRRAAEAAEREHQNSTLELWFECLKRP